MARTDLDIRPIDLPMAGTPRESVRDARITSDTPGKWGIRGRDENFNINRPEDIAAAKKLDSEGYQTKGLNIVTGRSKRTKFTGAR